MDITKLEKYRYYVSYFQTEFETLEKNRPWLSFDDQKVVVSSVERLKNKFNLNIETTEKYFYHPCEIAQAVCAYYDLFVKTKDKKYIELLLANTIWLENNYVEYKNAYVYPFPFAIKSFGNKAGWISGMYQGIILSAFIRANLITNDAKYLVSAQKVYNSYQFNLGEKYGFKVEDEYGLWFEESMLKPATHILNGFIYAIFGLYDFYKITKNTDVKTIIDRCFETLKVTLPQYDMGYWSYYDLNGTIASYSYHEKMHIPLLRALYEISGEIIFNTYENKWIKYNNSSYCRLRKKIYSFRRQYFKG